MYDFSPKKSNNAAQYTSIILYIAALVAMFFSTIEGLPFPAIMQLAALLMLCFATMILCRYMLKGYVYSISEDDGGYDFSVTELKGKSRITVCRISLSGIEKAVMVKKSEKKKYSAQSKGYKSFDYCVDMSPSECCCIFCEECGEKYIIKIQPDAKLLEILSQNNNKQANTEPQDI